MKTVRYICTLSDMAGKYNDTLQRWERGYISRKTEVDGNTAVYAAGDGRLFYRSASYGSTQYMHRNYLLQDGYYVRA